MALRAVHPYTATDPASGITADSLRAWREHRRLFSTFIRADLATATGQAGPAYADSGSGPVHPTLVLTDAEGRRLALNGTPGGFCGEGPRGAATILAEEGLLPDHDALAAVMAAGAGATFTRALPRVIDLRDTHRTEMRDADGTR